MNFSHREKFFLPFGNPPHQRSTLILSQKHSPRPSSTHMNKTVTSEFRPIFWTGGSVSLIDQTRLPQEEVWLEYSDYRDVILAIRNMEIRGAPAIGVAGAYAVALAALEFAENADFETSLQTAAREIREARPTGANLAWAVDRMTAAIPSSAEPDEVANILAEEACRQDVRSLEPGRGKPDKQMGRCPTDEEGPSGDKVNVR